MSKFIKKCIYFISILSIILVIFIFIPFPKNVPIAIIINKYELLNKFSSPKIVLVGGSNVLYSLSAESIKKETGYNSINMGINGGLGLQYDLEQLKPYVNNKDIIIISPEYENFEGNYKGDVNLLLVYSFFPESRNFINKEQLFSLIKSKGLLYFQTKFASYFDSIVIKVTNTNYEINNYGDLKIKNASRDVSNMNYQYTFREKNYSECLSIIKEFCNYSSEKGATVLIGLPALPLPQYNDNKIQIGYLYERLKKDLGKIVLYDPQEMMFEPNYFCDTVYHMNEEGRELRTSKTIEYLKKYIDSLYTD